jgi:hypothetical protein
MSCGVGCMAVASHRQASSHYFLMSTQTNLIDWVENASPEQLALIESVGPGNIVRMREELQQLKTGQADKNRALLKAFLDDHQSTIGALVFIPVAGLFLIALVISLNYAVTGASREYKYALDKVVECRKDMVSKGVDLDQVCGKIPQSPYAKP